MAEYYNKIHVITKKRPTVIYIEVNMNISRTGDSVMKLRLYLY